MRILGETLIPTERSPKSTMKAGTNFMIPGGGETDVQGEVTDKATVEELNIMDKVLSDSIDSNDYLAEVKKTNRGA